MLLKPVPISLTFRFLTLALIISLLPACGILSNNTKPKTPPSANEAPTVVSQPLMLEYATEYAKLNSAQQKLEFNDISSLANKDKLNIVYKLKLAVIYALPSSRLQDPVRANTLITDLLKTAHLHVNNEHFLFILRDYVADNLRLAQTTKDAQKRTENLQQKNEQLLQQNIQLEQKLEALKRIEKTMVDRDQGAKK